MNLAFIKLDINIMNDSKIKIIRKMPEGDSLLVLWIGLLCLAMKSGRPGCVELGDGIPFTVDMLSCEFDIPKATVQLGIETFQKLKMVETFEDGTFFLTNFEKHQELDKIEAAKEKVRDRVKKHREKVKQLSCNANVTVTEELQDGYTDVTETECNALEKEKEEEKEKEKDNRPVEDSPHFQIPVEFHKRLNKRLALTTIPDDKENLKAADLLRGIGDLPLILKCMDAFFDDSLDWWFTRKSKAEPNKRSYNFNTFINRCVSDLIPYVREKTVEDQSAAEKEEHRRVKASPPKLCPKCGKPMKQGTPEAVGCKACGVLVMYDAKANSWGEVA